MFYLGIEKSALVKNILGNNNCNYNSKKTTQIILKFETMNQNRLSIWFSTIALILILFGILYCFIGLKILPVDKSILLDWESDIYGAIMIGWGTTLFLIGKIAFRRQDRELLKVLLCGITLWLLMEAIFSFYLGVYFNVGVDIAVLVLFAYPIIKTLKRLDNKNN